MMLVKKAKKWNGAALITAAVRRIWLYSPIRREALKRAKIGKNICCEECGCATEKPEVHHDNQAEVYKIAKIMAEKLFPPADELTVCCDECHKVKHRKDN